MEEFRRRGIEPNVYPIPADLLSKINLVISEKIQAVRKIAKEQKAAIGIIGGFVRDLLLGKPSQDVDFVVFGGDFNKLTLEIAKQTDSKIGKMSNTTLTTQIRFKDGIVFEFNSARKEEYEFPNRTPKVSRGTIVDDLFRRDFTINSFVMFENVYFDIFNGKDDLKNKIIQTTREPELVFREDYLRMFRAVRFSSKLNFNIAEEVKEGIRINAKNIVDVPKERTLSELTASFTNDPVKTFKLMADLKLFETMFPDIRCKNLDETNYSPPNSWKKIEEKLQFLKSNNTNNISIILAVILMETIIDDQSVNNHESALVQKIDKQLRFFKFSNKERNEIVFLVKNRNSLLDLIEGIPSKLELRQAVRKLGEFLDAIILMTQAELSVKVKKKGLPALQNRLIEIRKTDELINFKLAIDGHEIEDLFGFKGQKIEQIKTELLRAIMNEEIINSKETCIKYIKDKYT
ncbi:MAG: CCA tRNA nucleotidyltransferase [Candidatus Heimdallarchaeota archaeon]|nr:CCA tRNA nucleotidyltransferase [Candidatus Heimdallarchaeota archaeon]